MLIWNCRKNDNEYRSWPVWLQNIHLASQNHHRRHRPSKPRNLDS
jgi:hypothetical protein